MCSVEIHIGGSKGPPDRVGSALFATADIFSTVPSCSTEFIQPPCLSWLTAIPIVF